MADGVKKINEWIMKDGRTINITKSIDATKLEGGTQFINPITGLLQYVNISNIGAKAWKHYDPMVIFQSQTIKTSLIADLNITTEKINNLAVTTEKINNMAVVEGKIGTAAVTETKIKDDSVTTGKILNSAVITSKINNEAVTNSKLGSQSVTNDKIFNETIINTNIANGTIQNAKMFNKTLENTKIKDKTIIESLFGDESVSTRALETDSVTTEKIALRNVIRSKIALKAIGSDEVDEEVIDTYHVSSLNASKLINNSILEPKYGDLSVSNRVLAEKSVSIEKLDENVDDLIMRSIRVETSQTVFGSVYKDTAWCKGSMLIQSPLSNGIVTLNVKGNIISTGTVTATKCFNPVFADLAEAYVPTEKMESGDPVCLSLDGNLKVEKLNKENTSRFIGFVSDEYATVFGATPEELKSGKKVAITLVGRIKIKMPKEDGKIGDYIAIVDGHVCNTGIARKAMNIGRLLENVSKTDSYALCQLWP